MNKTTSFSIWYVLLAIMAVVLVHDFIHALNKVEELPYSEFKRLVATGKVAEVSVTSHVLTGKLKAEGESKEQKPFATVRVEDPDLVRELNQYGVTFTGVIESTFWRDLLSWVIPVALFAGIWFFIFRRFGQAQGGFMQVGQSKAKIYVEKDIKVTFAVSPGGRSQEELGDRVRKTPEKFTKRGQDSQGSWSVQFRTGKTLLARAVAGEAGVTFFSIAARSSLCSSGSGRLVRDLFFEAKLKAPALFSSMSWMRSKARGASHGA